MSEQHDISPPSRASGVPLPPDDPPPAPVQTPERDPVPADDVPPGDTPPPPVGDPPTGEPVRLKEVGGPAGPEPTRYGDWERKGRVSDF
jgi:homeobox protein ESX1